MTQIEINMDYINTEKIRYGRSYNELKNKIIYCIGTYVHPYIVILCI